METMVAAVAAILTILFLVKPAQAKPKVPLPGDPEQPKGKTIPELIQENAIRYGVDPNLIHAHIQVESSGDPDARNLSDPSYGLMGITPILAQTYGYVRDYRFVTEAEIQTIWNPVNNIAIGTRYLAELHSKYPFDVATQMYNCGVKGYLKDGVRVPEYLAKIKRYYNA